jgi:hypothetical protein
MRFLAVAIAFVGLVGVQTTTPKAIDPSGKWSFSTVSDTGDPVSGTISITGTPGSYVGQATLADGTTLSISDVMTSPQGFMAVVDLPQGAGIFRLKRGADGKFSGAWAQFQLSYTITAERIGGGTGNSATSSR